MRVLAGLLACGVRCGACSMALALRAPFSLLIPVPQSANTQCIPFLGVARVISPATYCHLHLCSCLFLRWTCNVLSHRCWCGAGRRRCGCSRRMWQRVTSSCISEGQSLAPPVTGVFCSCALRHASGFVCVSTGVSLSWPGLLVYHSTVLTDFNLASPCALRLLLCVPACLCLLLAGADQ